MCASGLNPLNRYSQTRQVLNFKLNNMKKILTILFVLTGLLSQGQISDAKIRDTIALWIVPNLTKSITAAQMNAILDHLNNSKINKDSIVNVRTNAAEDSLFIKYKTTMDTIVLLHELDNLSDVVLTTPDASDMLILDDETMKWVNRPLIQVYGDMLDTAAKSPPVYVTWVRDTANGELYPADLTDKVGIGTATPVERLDVQNGNINLDTSSATSGQIKQNGSTIFHTYTDAISQPSLFIGKNVGNYTLTGNMNIGVGYNILKSATSGFSNTVLGYDIMSATTTGYYNVSIGYLSSHDLTGGYNNVVIGVGSLSTNTLGYSNISISKINNNT